MKRVLNYGPGVGTLIIGLCLYFLCGFGCLLLPLGLSDFEDHCMDNEILFSIRSDGRTIYEVIYGGDEVDALAKAGRSRAIQADFSIHIEVLPSGLQMITANGRYKSENIKDSRFSYPIWSPKNGSYFFLQHKETPSVDKSWVVSWSQELGSKKLVDSNDAEDLSLSLDEKSLVMSHWNSGPSPKMGISVYAIGSKTLTSFGCPNWIDHPVMIRDGYFLARKHVSGNYGQVIVWKPGQDDPKDGSHDVRIGGDLIDITSLDGELWAIKRESGQCRIVRINQNLDRVIEDVGWTEIEDVLHVP